MFTTILAQSLCTTFWRRGHRPHCLAFIISKVCPCWNCRLLHWIIKVTMTHLKMSAFTRNWRGHGVIYLLEGRFLRTPTKTECGTRRCSWDEKLKIVKPPWHFPFFKTPPELDNEPSPFRGSEASEPHPPTATEHK